MFLHYIYIHQYGDLFENAGFNFGGEYRFRYDEQSKLLTCERNEFHQKDFFLRHSFSASEKKDPTYAIVKNISALVGKNGSGKSSFLDFIRQNFARGMGGPSFPVIVALTNDDGQKKIYCDVNIALSNTTDGIEGFGILKIGKEIKKPNTPYGRVYTADKDEITEFKDADFIYYSDIFDHTLDVDHDGFYNISTSFLLKDDKRRKMAINDEWGASIASFASESEVLKSEDLDRQLQYITSQKTKVILPFEIPPSITVSISKDLLFSDKQKIGMHAQTMLDSYGYTGFIAKFINFGYRRFNSSSTQLEKVYIAFLSNALLNFIYDIAVNTRFYRIEEAKHLSFDSGRGFNSQFTHVIDSFIKDLKGFEEGSRDWDRRPGFNYEFELDQLNAFKDLMTFLATELDETSVTDKANSITITTTDLIYRFHKIYRRTYNSDGYLKFSWRDLSTGQRSFLNLYSRFHSLSDHVLPKREHGKRLKKNLIILIDEGENFMHPEWQRTFISKLLDVLPAILRSTGQQRTIQILLASNSAMLISDLPNTNLIFLKREKNEGVTIQDSLEDKKQTFAANIHVLLSDTFFLRAGTLGEFAREKINDVIELLQQSRDVITANQDFIKNTIAIIGEPVIKSKLLQMLRDRMSLDFISFDQRIKKLEQDVSKIKKTSRKKK